MKKIITGFLCIVCFYGNLFGQSPNLRILEYGLEEGLSHRLVTRVEKDQLGFIWLATPNGLNRFDGYEFLHFSAGASADFPISGHYIQEIEPIASGNFAITYKDNLSFFDFLNPTSFEFFPIHFQELLGTNSRVFNILPEKNGAVYVLWRNQNKYFISIVHQDKTVEQVLEWEDTAGKISDDLQLLKGADNNFFVFDGRLGLFLIKDKMLIKVPIESLDFEENTPLRLNFFKLDSQNRLWLSVFGKRGVYLYSQATNSFKIFRTPNGLQNIPRLWEDEKGNLIFGESGASFHPIFKKFHLLQKDHSWVDVSYFTPLDQFIVELESHDFFETTLFATVSGFKIATNKSTTIRHFLNLPEEVTLKDRVMRGFFTLDDKRLLVVNEDGYWYEFFLENDSITPVFVKDHHTGQPVPLKCSRQVIVDKNTGFLWSYYCTEEDKGWLLKVNPKTWEGEKIRIPKPVRAFCQTEEGIIWMSCATNNNDLELFQFDPKTATLNSFRNEEGTNPMQPTNPTFIKNRGNGTLWLGTYLGLYIIDVVNKTVDLYNRENGLSANVVETLLELDSNRIMVGTNEGLDIFNLKTGENQNFSKKNGLSANHIYGIQPGVKENTFWISTILGLNFFDLNTRSFYNFYEKDGLTDNEFNRFSHYRDKFNRLYFGGVNGFNVFKEDDLVNAPPAPMVQLTKVAYFDSGTNEKVTSLVNLSNLTEITLQPNDKYLDIAFSLPVYNNPENNQYQVKLEGYDEQWELLGNQNSVSYSTIPAGNYQLKIKGATSIGNWSEEALVLDLVVQQVFYKKWQFWFLCFLFSGLTLQIVNDYLLKQKLKVEKIRTKLSSDLHDELSGLLSGIAMQTELLEMTTSDTKSKPKLSKITKISRAAMGKMSDVIWSIDSRKDTVEDLISRMTEHTKDILDPLDIAWKLTVNNINRKNKMPVLLRENLYFIYKEAINNIGKHADTSLVQIYFGNKDNEFVLSIHNNGQPKQNPEKSNKTGQGTHNMKMRAEKIAAVLTKDNQDGFTVKITRKPFA